jgi:hypothetical protein
VILLMVQGQGQIKREVKLWLGYGFPLTCDLLNVVGRAGDYVTGVSRFCTIPVCCEWRKDSLCHLTHIFSVVYFPYGD